MDDIIILIQIPYFILNYIYLYEIDYFSAFYVFSSKPRIK